MIKWIAMFLMILDHIGYYLGYLLPDPVNLTLRLLGRLSFPVFAYSIALGYLRTRNRTRYFVRMLLFAGITQAALQVTAFYTHTGTFINVMFTFSMAILFMASAELLDRARIALRPDIVGMSGDASYPTDQGKSSDEYPDNRAAGEHSSPAVSLYGRMIPAVPAGIFAVAAMAVILGLTYRYGPDYNVFGIFSVYLFYVIQKNVRNPELALRQDRHALSIMFVSFLGLNLAWALFKIGFSSTNMYWILMEIFSVGAIGILLFDKPRKKPARWEKYFFYYFYPAHMVFLMIISYFFVSGKL